MFKRLYRADFMAYFSMIWCFLMVSAPLMASVDTSPPNIIYAPKFEQVSATSPLAISLSVTDNVAVKYVTLNYRFGSVVPYFQLSENRAYKKIDLVLSPDGDYVASIPDSQLSGNVFEYYIETSDRAGNITQQGSFNNPNVITFDTVAASSNLIKTLPPDTGNEMTQVSAGQNPMNSLDILSTGSDDSSDNKVVAWYENRLVWAVVGGIVLGAVLSSGGNDNNSSTGTITITAPPL